MLPEFPCPTRVAGWWLSVVDLLCELACELADLPYWNGYVVSVYAQSLVSVD